MAGPCANSSELSYTTNCSYTADIILTTLAGIFLHTFKTAVLQQNSLMYWVTFCPILEGDGIGVKGGGG